jgi:hypothetical protein
MRCDLAASGWVNSAGESTPGLSPDRPIQNYFAGVADSSPGTVADFRNFFIFDINPGNRRIFGALLEIANPSADLQPDSPDYAIRGPALSPVVGRNLFADRLIAGGTGNFDLYDALGTGHFYSQTEVGDKNVTFWNSFPGCGGCNPVLSQQFIADLRWSADAADDHRLVIAGTISGPDSLAFANTGQPFGAVELYLYTEARAVPEPYTALLLIEGLVCISVLGVLSRNRRKFRQPINAACLALG